MTEPQPKNDLSADEAEFRRTLLLSVSMLVVGAGMGLFYLADHFITKRYMAPFFQYKTSLLFGQAQPGRLIDDPNEVTIFRTAIVTAQDEDDSTYPIDQITFVFPDEPSKVYLLGRDSSSYEEFWLQAASPNGPVYLKEFRSQVLTDWLSRNAVR